MKILNLASGVVCIILLFASRSAAQSPDADSVAVLQLIGESRSLRDEENFAAALGKAQEARNLSMKRYGVGHALTAFSTMYVARGFRDLNREQEALLLFEQNLKIYQQMDDVVWQAKCHNNAQLCLRSLFRFEEAHAHARAAYALLRPDSAGNAALIANIRLNEASVFIAEKKFKEALPLLENAQGVLSQVNDAVGLGYVNYHLGGIYFGLNDFTRAREHYLSAWTNLHKLLKPSHSNFADLYVRIGRCCQKTGDPETGLYYLLLARDAYLKAGTEDLNYIAFMDNLGQFYFDEKQYAEAVDQFERSLEAKERYYGKNNRRLLRSLFNLGEAGILNGNHDRAEQCLRRGIQIIQDSCRGNPQLVFPFMVQLAVLEDNRGNQASCIELCDSAFVMSGFDPTDSNHFFPRGYARTLCTTYAHAHRSVFDKSGDLGKLQMAERFYRIAARLLFLEVAEISEESSREIFYDKDHGVLDNWLDVRMALHQTTGNQEHARMAFQIACQERAFLLSESMRKGGALRYAGVPDTILHKERSLREIIAEAEKKRMQNNYLPTNQTDSAALALNLILAGARKEHEALMLWIESDYPDYFHLRNLKNDVSPEALRNQFLANDQALLVYSPTNAGVVAFLLTRDTFVARQLALAPEIEAFNHSLTAFFTETDPNDDSYDRNLEQYTALAQRMYNTLVRPLEAMLPERLIIVPGGNLCYLPFEALLSGPPAEAGNWKTYPFWTKQKSIRYALSPDLSVQNKQIGTRKTGKNWLGLAPFATDTEGLATRNLAGEAYAPLPYSGKEVRTIAAQMHGEYWLNTASSADRFLREASAYRNLHFATHSFADDRQGDYSYLVLSPSGERLPARDLYQYELPADMVVLSSCEAGSGKLINGEGIIGLVRAFTYAGAKSVVASQWVTGDQSSAELMIAFYRFLGQGLSRDQALRSARLHLMANRPDQGHPFFWAGFRLYGE